MAEARVVSIVGARDATRAAARALLTQLSCLHSPAELSLALCASPRLLAEWHWMSWLPHTHTLAGTGGGSVAFIADSIPSLLEVLAQDLETRCSDAVAGRRSGTVGRPGRQLIIVIDGEYLTHHIGFTLPDAAVDLRTAGVTVDLVAPALAESLARQLAPHTTTAEPALTRGMVDVDWAELVGIGDPVHPDVSRLWAGSTSRDLLRATIGVTDVNEPLIIDLKESALGGMGPHGLVVGATGSGKSELRTLVLGLAATHHPDRLALVLIDFKGGATFAGLAAPVDLR